MVQEIAKKKNPKTPDHCQTIIDILNEKLDSSDILKNLNNQDAVIFARHAEAVVKSFDVADYNIALLIERLGNYPKEIGNLDKALQCFNDYNPFIKRTL